MFWGWRAPALAHLSARHGAEGVGWPDHRLGVHHGGRIHHPQRAHLWRLRSTETQTRSERVDHFIHSALAGPTVFPLTMLYPIMPVGVVAGKLMIEAGCSDRKVKTSNPPRYNRRYTRQRGVEMHGSPWRQGSRLWSGLLWAASWCRRSSSSPLAGSSGCRCGSAQSSRKPSETRPEPFRPFGTTARSRHLLLHGAVPDAEV